MHVLRTLALQALRWNFKVRLAIVGGLAVVSLLIYALTFHSTQNATVIIVPVVCAAWLFGYRGTLFCIVVVNLMVMLLTCFFLRSIFWPAALLTTTLIGIMALVVISSLISYLRYALILVEVAQKKVLEAERERGIANAQRLEAVQMQQEMSRAYEHEKHLSIMKDEFIMNVSHELRTPLAEMYGYLELLIDYGEKLEEGMLSTFLRKANDGCSELIGLVNSMLDSIEASDGMRAPQVEEMDVAAEVRGVLPLFDPLKEQDFYFVVEVNEGTRVLADRQYLRQILRNLLSNALKYAPKQTTIVVSANTMVSGDGDARAGTELCICVKDEGPGIPGDELPYLFGKFTRLQRDVSGSIRGTGLGLYISKQLVEAMRGRIWVESTGVAGEGSCFCFTLPEVVTAAKVEQDMAAARM